MTKIHEPLPPKYEKIAKLIVDAAYTVHKNLGLGLLEGVYEPCFCHELGKRGTEYKRQIAVPLVKESHLVKAQRKRICVFVS